MPAPALRIASSAVLLALAAGCASMGKDECISADWYAVGLEDGARGRPVERLGDHRRACAEHRVTPDAARYVAGRNEGLKSFCTYQRGFSHGRAGQSYSGACPEALAAGFVAGYERGRELHGLQRRLGTVDKEVARIKAALKDGIPNPKTRSMEIERLEALSRESEQLQGAIARLENE